MTSITDEAFLRGLGFLPDGDEDNNEWGRRMYGDDDGDEEPHMQLLIRRETGELFIEAYTSAGATLAVTKIQTPPDQAAFLSIAWALNCINEETLRRHAMMLYPSPSCRRPDACTGE